ncbi:hypothetical protein TNCV_627461 [Trichonephila clavipes]|nr:hypothetical protein TNCV_627461 [Trichonephila clavipes]
MTRRKWYMHDFLAESKNCWKKRPPTKMQTSHRRRRECRTLANTPGISRISPATMVILATRSCVNETLQMAPEEEV